MIQPAGTATIHSAGDQPVETRTLADLPAGVHAAIREVIDSGQAGGAPDDALLRLRELGMTPGTPIVVTRRGLAGDPLEVEVRGTRLCLRRAHASCFQLTAAPSGRGAP